MFDVACGPERVRLDRASLSYVGPPDGWLARWPYGRGSVEAAIEGDDDGPHPQLVELAEALLPGLAAIEAAADAYLRAFVDTERLSLYGAWELETLVLALTPGWLRGTREFEATLAIANDDYGRWAVRFRHYWPTDVFSPYLFSRRQW